jgi:hypothetical protein
MVNLLPGKSVSTITKIIFAASYIILITLFDVYSYGIVYQQKIKQENYSNTFWSWVFNETVKESGNEHIQVTTYRIIQQTIQFGGIIIIFYYCGVWTAIGLLISHYLMSYDLLFYLLLGQTHLFAEFQKYNSAYWLQNWYQAGYFILQPFNPCWFYISGITGIIIAFAFCFIHPVKYKRSYTNA